MLSPDLVIGPRHDPQTIRWHIFVLFGLQLSLHKWLRSDSDRALHDHKADNISVILSPRGFVEHIREYYPGVFVGRSRSLERHGWLMDADGRYYKDRTYYRRAWRPYFRKAETLHRVTLIDGRPVWTLWLRFPSRRRWGYYCDGKGWVDADQYNKAADYYADGVSEVGRGCD